MIRLRNISRRILDKIYAILWDIWESSCYPFAGSNRHDQIIQVDQVEELKIEQPRIERGPLLGGGLGDTFLLLETGDFLLLETGDRIILEITVARAIAAGLGGGARIIW